MHKSALIVCDDKSDPFVDQFSHFLSMHFADVTLDKILSAAMSSQVKFKLIFAIKSFPPRVFEERVRQYALERTNCVFVVQEGISYNINDLQQQEYPFASLARVHGVVYRLDEQEFRAFTRMKEEGLAQNILAKCFSDY